MYMYIFISSSVYACKKDVYRKLYYIIHIIHTVFIRYFETPWDQLKRSR